MRSNNKEDAIQVYTYVNIGLTIQNHELQTMLRVTVKEEVVSRYLHDE